MINGLFTINHLETTCQKPRCGFSDRCKLSLDSVIFSPFIIISLIKYIYICLILGLVSFVASDFLDAASGDELAMWGKLDVDQYLPNRSKLHYTMRRCHF